mgnify:CR=1 FL=1
MHVYMLAIAVLITPDKWTREITLPPLITYNSMQECQDSIPQNSHILQGFEFDEDEKVDTVVFNCIYQK